MSMARIGVDWCVAWTGVHGAVVRLVRRGHPGGAVVRDRPGALSATAVERRFDVFHQRRKDSTCALG